MNSYRLAVNLKLGLIITAVLIAVASLFVTNWLTSQLKEREQRVINLYVDALGMLWNSPPVFNPYQNEWSELQSMFTGQYRNTSPISKSLDAEKVNSYLKAFRWAENMPEASGEVDFVYDNFLEEKWIQIPLVITDSSTSTIIAWNIVGIDSVTTAADTLAVLALARSLDSTYEPLVIEVDGGSKGSISQIAHYGESSLVRWLRYLPFIQFFFVSLFILVGYLGFSYVRRNEQSNLWVGMAKEAAHQLGTPISSLMGWSEILRMDNTPSVHRIAEELDKDVARLQRVANRFSKIGSEPVLEYVALAPAIGQVVEYIQRRLPQMSEHVTLESDIPNNIYAAINVELFEWVVENLVKNAIDAFGDKAGVIKVKAVQSGGRIAIDVVDQGKGISKRDAKYIFRPGFSTKKRGWGLGLSLAKRIVEDYHGGELNLLESRVGKGTTFRIELNSEPPLSDP